MYSFPSSKKQVVFYVKWGKEWRNYYMEWFWAEIL